MPMVAAVARAPGSGGSSGGSSGSRRIRSAAGSSVSRSTEACVLASADPAQCVGFLRSGARPPIEQVITFIDENKDGFGVEPICRELLSCERPRDTVTCRLTHEPFGPARRHCASARESKWSGKS